MVRDGILYALALAVAAALLFFLSPWVALIPLLLAAFFLWFFRDPERVILQDPGLIVSPADGKITDISPVEVMGRRMQRISMFLNVFDVHVNRSPISGVIRAVEYRKGKFCNAMDPTSCEVNEQNIVTVEGDGQTVIFKQIAGLLARRIVFTKKVGDAVTRGERIGLIKFGSRVDVIMDAGVEMKVKIGDHVAGGSTILAVNLAVIARSGLGTAEVPSAYSGSTR
jgi:phosphatidylserine decarboxylase